jgi:DNA-directed RNA polymerase specialized sigma24 family protein
LTQVADVLEIPVGTAKSRLNRALESMRVSMAADRPASVLERVRERSA